MKLLAIETSTRLLGVAIIEGPQQVTVDAADGQPDRLLASLEVEGDRVHGAGLPELVAEALNTTSLTVAQLDGLIVDIGPGSFAGLRIGVAYVKGLTIAAHLPVATVCALDLIAENSPKVEREAVCPIIDAKQRKVYSARYIFRGPREYRQPPALLTIEQVIERCGREPTYFLGDGLTVYREALAGALGERARFAPESAWRPRIAAAARQGITAFRAGKLADPSTLVPMYLYPWDCSIQGGTGRSERLPQPPQIQVQ